MRHNTQKSIRHDAIAKVKSILSENGLDELLISDIDEGNSPVVQWGNDDADTYTLDEISLNTNGTILFNASSCWTSGVWDENDISTDALIDIVDFLEENEEIIKEYAEEI